MPTRTFSHAGTSTKNAARRCWPHRARGGRSARPRGRHDNPEPLLGRRMTNDRAAEVLEVIGKPDDNNAESVGKVCGDLDQESGAHAVTCGDGGQGRGRTADLPIFRLRHGRPARYGLVRRPRLATGGGWIARRRRWAGRPRCGRRRRVLPVRVGRG
jgi:hypothetical protein